MTRAIVLLRNDVAPANWRRSFTELHADAINGVDGIQATEEQADESGHWLHEWWNRDQEPPVLITLAPVGFASFYEGEHGKAFLYTQNY